MRWHGRGNGSGRAAALACGLAVLLAAAGGSVTTSLAATPDMPAGLDIATARAGTAGVRGDLGSPEPFRLLPGPAAPGPLAADPAGDSLADKWRRVSAGIAADRAVLAACRVARAGCPEAARRFQGVVAQAEAETGRARLGVLNRAINLAIAYTSDLVQHGRDDVWSPPLATFASRMGDCEDYAIAKYLALLEAGVAEEDLRIVIVDERRSGLHAVASVRLGGAWLVLDNRRMALVEDRDLADYRAVATFDQRAPGPIVADAGAGRPDAPQPSGASGPAS